MKDTICDLRKVQCVLGPSSQAMSIRMSGVYFAPAITTPQTEKIANNTSGLEDQTDKANGAQQPNNKTVTILAPNRSNSLDYLNFEEKRQLIASSLSLSDILHCGPAAAAAAAKEVAANTVIGGEALFISFQYSTTGVGQ